MLTTRDQLTRFARNTVCALSVTLGLLWLGGCQANPPPDYRTLTERISAGEDVSPQQLRAGFVAAPDYVARMERLTDLEMQAFAVIEDEPLKLGSLGTAILDTYYGSLTGHYVLARFYRHLESMDTARLHEAWVQRIQASMVDSAVAVSRSHDRGSQARDAQDGDSQDEGRDAASSDDSLETYLPAATTTEALIYALSRGLTPVGTVYRTSEAVPFALMVRAAPVSGPLQTLDFDLTSAYNGMKAAFAEDAESDDKPLTPLSLIGYLAKDGDTAAQTAVGGYLASQGHLIDATNWLRSASRTGNLIANSLLGQIFWDRARRTRDPETRQQHLEEAEENYLHAIALGSDDAMSALAALYLNGRYGAEKVAAGIPLLEQAVALNNRDAATYLAYLYYAGKGVAADLGKARDYYVRAAELGDPEATRNFARFLLDRDTDVEPDARLTGWLNALADKGDADAMLLLGNLTARGLTVPADSGAAREWYRKAIDTAPLKPSVVNEIAWTLAVSHIQDLRDPEFAREIMDRLMESDSAARQRPEYIDTWAAIYAAIGDFERAITLQQEAVTGANEELAEVAEVLAEHLLRFQAGETISEAVP